MLKQSVGAVVLLAGTLALAQSPTAAPQFAQTWADFAKPLNDRDPAAAAAVFATDGEL